MTRARKILSGIAIVLALLVLGALYLYMFERPSHSVPRETAREIKPSGDAIVDSIRRGAEYLRIHQEPDGHFSRGMLDPKPGFTAMVVDALARSPEKFREDKPFIKKATEGIIALQRPTGAICSPLWPLETYTTSVSILALTALENPAHAAVIEKAKNYLIDVQYKDDEANPAFGGAGYSKNGKVTGDVTGQWVEALKSAGVKEGDPAFSNAQKFFSRLQNNPETNDKSVEGFEPGDDGGLFYRPGESKVPSQPGKSGKKIAPSYGLMSYTGLKSFLYMGVTKDDPRVQSAFKWVKNNYTLDENRNIGADGLFYYYLAMAKALAVYGEPEITLADGTKHVWAKELSERIISMQDADGSWKNKVSGRWSEDDSVLVSAYAIRTLTICHEELHKK